AVIARFLLFFFSSRRRHTRWPRDWSSDVCSSDLEQEVIELRLLAGIIVSVTWVRRPGQKAQFDHLLLKLPMLGQIAKKFSTSQKIGRASCRERELVEDGDEAGK